MKRFREESNNLYSGKTGTEKNIEKITSFIPQITKDLAQVIKKADELADSEQKSKPGLAQNDNYRQSIHEQDVQHFTKQT